jgi:glutathione S-transferase
VSRGEAVLQLFQAEWCPASHSVRERLTELGLDYIVRQVPADKRQRSDLLAATGTDTVPVLVTDDRRILDGEERILAFLGEHYLEPRGAWMHRARAEKTRRRYLEEECECSPLTAR